MAVKARKQLIRINDRNECMYIIHAFPRMDGSDFEWYVSNHKNSKGIKIPNQHYELITYKSEDIREFQWNNMYLHCEYQDEHGVIQKSEYVKIHEHFLTALKFAKYDLVNVFTKSGMEDYPNIS